MRPSIRLLLLLLPVFSFAACGSDGEGDDPGPCHGVICQPGQDCKKGVCVDREDPEPSGCVSNMDCQHDPAGKLCDLETHACVQCLRTMHCAEGRECVGGSCLGTVCSSDGDCGGGTPHCNPAGDACVACLSDGQCADGERCEEGSCVAPPRSCEEDADCVEADPSKPHCLSEGERSFCVECLSSAGCAEGFDCRGGSCVDTACEGPADCLAFPDLPHCAEDGGCVACLENGHCEAGSLCVEGRCEKPFVCHDDGECAGRPEGGACDRASGSCVQCVVDSHCAAGSVCGGNRCAPLACGDVSDCPVGTRCDVLGCVPAGACNGHESCAFDPRAPFCGDDGACVGCLADGDCGGDLSCVAGACLMVESCRSDLDCGGGLSCTGGVCRSCRTDEQCPTGVCLSGRCSDRPVCGADGDCAGGRCRGGSCVACVADLDCGQGRWCEEGRCAESSSCSEASDCGPGKQCQGGTCVAAGCVDDGFEPDGGFERATGLTMGMAAQRSLCPNDEDWFVFTEDAGDSLLAELQVAPVGTRMSLVWFEEGSRSRREIEAPESKLLVRALPPAAAGRYYLRVRSAEGATGSYRLRIQPGPAGCTDILEPNDVREAPRMVKTDVFYGDLAWCGDDFYLVSPEAGSDLRIHVFGPGNPTIDVFDAVSNSRLIVDRVDTGLLGGGKIAVLTHGRHQGRDVLVRLANPSHAGRSYSMFLGGEGASACGQEVLIPLGSDRGRVEGSTLAQTSVAVRPVCGASGPEATWRVEVEEASRLVVAARAGHPLRIALNGEDCGGVMSCLPVPTSTTGILDVPELLPGVYVVSVADAGATGGAYELTARLLPPEAPSTHDVCSQAIALDPSGGPVRVVGTTLGAGGTALSCGQHLPTVYYRFDAGSGADKAVIEVTAAGPVIVSTHDNICQGQSSCQQAATSHSFKVRLSDRYTTVAIASATGEAVDFNLGVEVGSEPVFSGCAFPRRNTLTLPADVTGTTRLAENNLSFPLAQSCTGYWLNGNDHFYELSLAAGQSIEATLTPGADFDGALYVIDRCTAPMCLAGTDQAPRGGVETLRFTAPTEGSYRLVVDSAAGGGSYRLVVR